MVESDVQHDDAPVHGSAVHGNVPFPAVWLAIACLGLGAFLANGYRTGMFQPDGDSALRPWMFAALAAMALVVGIAFAGFGARDVKRALARRHGPAPGSTAPAWTWDHPWDRNGVADRSGSELVTLLVMAPAWCLLLAPFVAVVFFPGGEFNWRGGGLDAPWWVTAMVGVFAFLGIGLVIQAVNALVTRLCRAPPFLRFDRFPFLLGDRLVATLEMPDPIAADRVTVTLRCLREHVVRKIDRATRETTTLGTEHEQLYSDTATIELHDRGTRRLPIVFDLPADAPATRLSDARPLYWKVDVRLPNGAVGFVVPVYQR